MALLGENGAGKSTLMKILSGVYTRDEGKMEIFGKSYDDLTPKQAQEAGVAIIHQELNMIQSLNTRETFADIVHGDNDLIHSIPSLFICFCFPLTKLYAAAEAGW